MIWNLSCAGFFCLPKKDNNMNISKSSKGMMLVSTLALLIVLFILGFSLLATVSGDYFQAGKTKADLQAYYLAQSGLNYVRNEMGNRNRRVASYIDQLAGEEMPMSTGTFKITLIDAVSNPSKIKIESTGTAAKTQKTIEAVIDLSNGVVTEGIIK